MLTSHPDSKSLICRPARYRIRVQGRITPAFSDFLQGMKVTAIEAPDQSIETELTGQLPDQAALMGVLKQLNIWLLPVIGL